MSIRRLTWCGFALLLLLDALAQAALPDPSELHRLQHRAHQSTIVRDNWGIPHISGKRDADAVFGLMYAQAEDDFARIELNYINAMGRLAEVEGESAIFRDLRMKLFINPADLKTQYRCSPAWLRQLMDAFADGLNYYLYTHPQVRPRLITHFEPWMALSFSEGSIGGDIESIDLKKLEQFYGNRTVLATVRPDEVPFEAEPRGSNGIAIAPSISANGHTLLLINPHTSFYFRPEVHARSDEGLNAYGAVTWGQFFVYQGFNPHLGWMHTSGGASVINEYLETVSGHKGAYQYRYGASKRPLRAVHITLPYKTAMGMMQKEVTVYYSHHGPIVRAENGKWIAVQLMQSPQKALMQSYLRTKAKDYAGFLKVMDLRTNSSNNTVYADDAGNIAYFHGNFVPRRNPKFDWRHPLDGSNPQTDWQGLHAVNETIHILNPANGWIQNTNNWPFSVAGPDSPKRDDYPDYMWVNPENARGLHAVRVLAQGHDWTIDRLISAAYDSYLTGFDRILPHLLKSWDQTPADSPLRAGLDEQIAVLRAWDQRFALDSVATSLAIYWGQDLLEHASAAARAKEVPTLDYVEANITATEMLESLRRASAKLTTDFGSWKTPWGDINRFQRLSGAVNAGFDDAKPSLPVPFTSSIWGALAAFGVREKGNTKKIYGDKGNSFVAVVEFGPRIRAKSILAGGESSDPASPHFNDQATMYSKGEFKDVLFYPEEIRRHAERIYHPGQ